MCWHEIRHQNVCAWNHFDQLTSLLGLAFPPVMRSALKWKHQDSSLIARSGSGLLWSKDVEEGRTLSSNSITINPLQSAKGISNWSVEAAKIVCRSFTNSENVHEWDMSGGFYDSFNLGYKFRSHMMSLNDDTHDKCQWYRGSMNSTDIDERAHMRQLTNSLSASKCGNTQIYIFWHFRTDNDMPKKTCLVEIQWSGSIFMGLAACKAIKCPGEQALHSNCDHTKDFPASLYAHSAECS